MKVAIEGCLHSQLDVVYSTLAQMEEEEGFKVDILLCCGDFQSVRNLSDLDTMSSPKKYHKMGDFHRYYSGEKVAPILTVFIGGNHEASSYLQELPYGGWVAKNIYYLGYAGVVQFRGLRIGGISGIYKPKDYRKGHYEHPPYNEGSKRTAYHIRNLEVFRLKQIKHHMDIMISHDWPEGITDYGDAESLFEQKPWFREGVATHDLGSPPTMEVLKKLQPRYWFAAHMHSKFYANVEHQNGDSTKFLALSLCTDPGNFLQVVTIDHDVSQPLKLKQDPEWLCILKNTNALMSIRQNTCYMPDHSYKNRHSCDYSASDEHITDLSSQFNGDFDIPEDFQLTAPVYHPTHTSEVSEMYINHQTKRLCDALKLINPYAEFLASWSGSRGSWGQHAASSSSSGRERRTTDRPTTDRYTNYRQHTDDGHQFLPDYVERQTARPDAASASASASGFAPTASSQMETTTPETEAAQLVAFKPRNRKQKRVTDGFAASVYK